MEETELTMGKTKTRVIPPEDTSNVPGAKSLLRKLLASGRHRKADSLVGTQWGKRQTRIE